MLLCFKGGRGRGRCPSLFFNLQNNRRLKQGRQGQVWTPVKKYFRPPSKGRPAKQGRRSWGCWAPGSLPDRLALVICTGFPTTPCQPWSQDSSVLLLLEQWAGRVRGGDGELTQPILARQGAGFLTKRSRLPAVCRAAESNRHQSDQRVLKNPVTPTPLSLAWRHFQAGCGGGDPATSAACQTCRRVEKSCPRGKNKLKERETFKHQPDCQASVPSTVSLSGGLL